MLNKSHTQHMVQQHFELRAFPWCFTQAKQFLDNIHLALLLCDGVTAIYRKGTQHKAAG